MAKIIDKKKTTTKKVPAVTRDQQKAKAAKEATKAAKADAKYKEKVAKNYAKQKKKDEKEREREIAHARKVNDGWYMGSKVVTGREARKQIRQEEKAKEKAQKEKLKNQTLTENRYNASKPSNKLVPLKENTPKEKRKTARKVKKAKKELGWE